MRMSFVSFVAKQPRLRRMANELFRQGIIRVGDVLQLSALDVATRTTATPREMDCLERFLAEGELPLHMDAKILGWNEIKPSADQIGR